MYGFDMVYKEGSRLAGGGSILIVETDAACAQKYRRYRRPHGRTTCLGATPLEREIIWQDLKRLLSRFHVTPPGES